MSDVPMIKNWDTYGRQGVDLASAATSLGFNAVKFGTRFGVSGSELYKDTAHISYVI